MIKDGQIWYGSHWDEMILIELIAKNVLIYRISSGAAMLRDEDVEDFMSQIYTGCDYIGEI